MTRSRSATDGERRQVTVLFADMQGYTPLAERLGEEKVYELMNRVYERMLNAVHNNEGTVLELTGDGILALFGAPLAIEDAPVRASRAALEIQSEMDDLGAALEQDYGVHPRVRIGLNTGPVVVGTLGTDLRMEFKAVGDTVNLASRLESMAEPGTILISEVTHRLVDAYVESTCIGEKTIKGKAKPQRCYRMHAMKLGVERFDASLLRGLTPLVGLGEEFQILKERLRQAGEGHACVVDIAGDAGSGKSRLLYEFKRTLREQDVRVLETHCTAYGRSTAFLPVIKMMKAMLGLHERMSQEESEIRVTHSLNELGLEAERLLPLLLNILGLGASADYFRGLDGEIIGARTRDALMEVIRAYCHRSTTIILVEDLHWMDSATETFLKGLIDAGEPKGSLVVLTHRPDYRSPWIGNSNSNSDVARLELLPLREDDCAQLVRHGLGSFAAREDLVRCVVKRVEGNPLFAEEMSRYLQDTVGIAQTHHQGATSHNGLDGVLPESLWDIIMARVDRLGEREKELLHALSVAGREFSWDLIQRISNSDSELPDLVRTLEDTGLIVRLEQGNYETFHFRHVLVQEAVYDSLLANRRALLHQRIAEALEALHTQSPAEYAEVLAYHWQNSGQPARAIPFLAMAAEKSLGVYSLDEADQWFLQAMEQMEAAPEFADDSLLADVLLGWARVYYYRKDFRGLIRLLERHRERVRLLGDRRRLSLVLFWLGFAHYFGARYETSRTLLREALQLGRQEADMECIGYASLGLMFVCANTQNQNQEETIERLGEEVWAAATVLSDVYLESKYLLAMSIHTIYQGCLRDARHFCERMRELGESAGDPRTIAMSHWAAGFVDVFEEGFEKALQNAEASLQCSPDPLDRLMARTVKGAALALTSDPKEGLRILGQTRQEMADADYLAPLLGVDIPYGAAMVLVGRMKAGVRWIEDAIERFRHWGSKTQPAFGRLVLGEIYLQMALGDNRPSLGIMLRNLGFILANMPFAAARARKYLEESASQFRTIGVPAYLARAYLDLAMLNLRQKRTDKAYACLVEASSAAKSQAPALYAKITRMLEQLPA